MDVIEALFELGTVACSLAFVFVQLVITLSLFVFSVVAAGGMYSGRKAKLAAAAEQLGLQPTHDGIRGQLEGVEVAVDTFTRSSGKSRQVYTRARAFLDLPPNFRMSNKGVLHGLLGGRDLEIGDPHFDHKIHMYGRRAEALARLDRTRRPDVLDAIRGGVAVGHGAIHFSKSGWIAEADKLEAMLKKVVTAAKLLELSTSVFDALLQRAQDADEPVGVRVYALHALDNPPDEVLVALVRDPEPRIRVAANQARGDAAALLVLALDDGLDDTLRVQALDHLAQMEALQPGQGEAFLLGLLKTVDNGPAVRLLETAGTPTAVPHLRAVERAILMGEKKNAALRSIRAIQARVTGDPQRGGVSLASQDGGAVSLAEPPDKAPARPKRATES